MTYTLVLLRHGESDWNAKNLFTGWVDVALTDKGRAEAVRGGELLVEAGHPARRRPHLAPAPRDQHRRARPRRRRSPLDPGEALVAPQRAPLRRAPGQGQEADARGVRRGAVHALAPLVRHASPAARRLVGVLAGRRPAYADLGEDLPRTECLKDVIARFLPYWEGEIVPDLTSGKTVLVAAHGNSLRALVKHLDGISDEDIAALNIPTGMPLLYRLDERPQADRAGWRVPRPRGRCRCRRGRGEPGPLSSTDLSESPPRRGLLHFEAFAKATKCRTSSHSPPGLSSRGARPARR